LIPIDRFFLSKEVWNSLFADPPCFFREGNSTPAKLFFPHFFRLFMLCYGTVFFDACGIAFPRSIKKKFWDCTLIPAVFSAGDVFFALFLQGRKF